MVLRDNYVKIKYSFIQPGGIKLTQINEIIKTVDKIFNDLVFVINFKNSSDEIFEVQSCVLKNISFQKDVTSIINSKLHLELKNYINQFLEDLNMEDACLEVLVDCRNKIVQCSEDDLMDSSANSTFVKQFQSMTFDETRDFDSISETNQIKSTKKICNNMKNSKKKFNDILDYNTNETSVNLNNEDSLVFRYVGLVNQAMTCYLNSLLQALYMTPEFRNALYNWEYKSSVQDAGATSIPYQLQKLFLNLQTSIKHAVETTSLTTSFGWDSNEAWQQHDIQELCRVMFDALEQNFKNTAQADLINKLYEGKINDYVKCLTCNTEKFREDTFLDIPLPVRPFDNTVAYGSVEEALEAFVKYETLEGNNQYFCEKCDKKSDAHKGLKFTKFPYILTLQLKRFDFDQNVYHRIKLNDKVTFPDILNLNNFIELTTNKELNREKDAGMNINGEDNFTTNSTINEECPCDIPISNCNHLNNHDQDDDFNELDEGIEIQNGTSSSSTTNSSTAKREEYATAKGPYIYDLFSVMIHSGSASGGHYYAYIKDFRNNKWLSFNDVSVLPITQEDIQRSYGGGTRVGSYNGAYRSSTNAYMLMYRQIDPERNTLPMEAKDFPPHIKDLVEKMKKNEEDRNYDEQESKERLIKQSVYYRHPTTYNVEQVSIYVSRNYTLSQIAEFVYKKANIEDLVDLDQCRIVSYHVKYDLIDCTYDPNTKYEEISTKYMIGRDLLLDIRSKSESFDNLRSSSIITKVYVIDVIEKDLIEAPKYVRAYFNQSIKEYKQELTKHFNLDPNIVELFGREIIPDKILNDDYRFEQHLSSKYPYKICASEFSDSNSTQTIMDSTIYKMSEILEEIVTFYIDPNVVTEEREKLNVPSLSKYYEENKISKITGGDEYCVNEFNLKELFRKPQDSTQNLSSFDEVNSKMEKWSGQETSASEDSSLSDSDRTLVGDAPEESENDYESSLTLLLKRNKNNDIELEKFFKLFKLKRPNIWKVTMDENITEEELKKKLEPYLNIPKHYFRVVDSSIDECNSFATSSKFREDQKYSICLERIIQPDEIKVDIYVLKMDSSDPIQKLFSAVLKQNTLIGVAKLEILRQMKQYCTIELPYERWSFMECTEDWIGSFLMDDQKNLSEIYKSICIQELPDETLFGDRISVYVRKWDRAEMRIEDPTEILIMQADFSSQLVQKITLLSNIPSENLEFTTTIVKRKYSFHKIDTYLWKTEIKPEEINMITYILFRDSREPEKNLVTNVQNNIDSYKRSFRRERLSGYLSTPVSSSPRKEKALKIHVDST